MSLPRFVIAIDTTPHENALLTLNAEQSRHLSVLRLQPGDALELLLPVGPWRADLATIQKSNATVRLVCPIHEDREAPIAIQACLPITAQLSLWDDWLPGCVELGVSLIQPIIYHRSEFDARKTSARMERWQRIISGACEQSHRSRIPELREPLPFGALKTWRAEQKWVAYEVMTGESNPVLKREAIAFTHGPEGGITDAEYKDLRQNGWQSLSLGKSILRAATCPAAILGAIQSRLY